MVTTKRIFLPFVIRGVTAMSKKYFNITYNLHCLNAYSVVTSSISWYQQLFDTNEQNYFQRTPRCYRIVQSYPQYYHSIEYHSIAAQLHSSIAVMSHASGNIISSRTRLHHHEYQSALCMQLLLTRFATLAPSLSWSP